MNVFRTDVPEGFEWVLPIDAADFETFHRFDGTSKRQTWKPVRVRLLSEDDHGRAVREADLPWLGHNVIVLTARAVSAIGGFLGQWGELLPLACDDKDLVVFNACRVIDALDEERSDVVRFDSGRIMDIETYIFRADAVGDVSVFKLSQDLRGSIYTRGRLVDLVDSHELRGTRFKLVWSDDTS